MHHRGETVGGTGGIGNDVMVSRIIKMIIHPHHHCKILIFCRGGNNHFLGSSLDMALGFLSVSE